MRKVFLVICIFLLIVGIEPIVSKIFMFNGLELATYDMRSKLALDKGLLSNFNHSKHADKKIVIVAVDDYSKKQIAAHPELNINSWPWRRDVWTPVVDFIEKGKPKTLLFDFVFDDLKYSYSYDGDFAGVLGRYKNIVLATSLSDPKQTFDKLSADEKKKLDGQNRGFTPTGFPLMVQIDNQQLDDSITYYSHSSVYNAYTRHNLMGVVHQAQDNDSVIRTAQPIFKLVKNGESIYLPSLAFAGFLKYIGEGGSVTVEKDKLTYKGREIPITSDGVSPINWHGAGGGKEYDYVHEIGRAHV